MKISKWSMTNGLWLILIIAAMLRLWNLGIIPPSLTPDEAALGYNAYSILQTGKDEHGEFMPLIFKSFGDYKPGLYVYAATPFVAIFGLNEWSVRLPSAIAGILSVYLIYLIVFSLSTKHRSLSTVAAFVAATSPWLIHFSRGAWEANLSLTLTLAGIYYFLHSLHKSYFLLPTSISFALTFLAYQGAKLSTSIVILLLICIYLKDFWKKYQLLQGTVLVSILIFVVITIPVVSSILSGKTGRLEVFSVFSYPRSVEYTQSFLAQGKEKIGDFNHYLFHSESLNFARGVLGRWFNHFSGRYLFFEGDYQNPRHSAPNHGMLLLFDLILIPVGLIYLIRSKKIHNIFKWFVFLWLILSPLPAVLSRDQVQAVRALNMAVPMTVVSALGLYAILEKIVSLRVSALRITCFCLSLISYLLSLAYFLDSYFVHLPTHNAKYWYYGHKQVVDKVTSIQQNYEKVLIQQSYDQPYIYFLFYTKYDPAEYQNVSNLAGGGIDVGLVEKLGNIEFKALSWPPPVGNEKTLVVGNSIAIPSDFPRTDFNLIEEIKFPDNFSVAFRIIENKNK